MPQAGSPVYDGPASGRASIVSMPIITENGEINRAIPRIPLRVPRKNPRRSLPAGSIPPPIYIPPVSAAYGSSSARSKEERSDFDNVRSHSGTPSPPLAYADGQLGEKRWNESARGRGTFLILVGIFIAVIVGLAVGLSIGLRPHSKDAVKKSDGSITQPFPAGFFSFDTFLRHNDTGCTSRQTTWSCYPGSPAGRASFHWSISLSAESHLYMVTGTDNPFVPAFSGLSMTLLDRNQDSERFTFAFSANKTVIPSDASTPGNRAANCTYPGTVFQATLWTRRKGNETIDVPKNPAKFALWPGDVQIDQVKSSVIGQPLCVDDSGGSIADIQAASGNCECRYTTSGFQ